MTQTNELLAQWQKVGPIAWAEGPVGWTMDDGKSVTLAPWQRAALTAWWEHRAGVSTFAVSVIKKSGKTTVNAILTAWRWLSMPGLHYAAANDLDQAQSLQFLMIADMCKRNPYLRENVTIGKSQLVFNPTGATLTALAGDYAGAAGGNFLTVSHTEAWGVQYENAIRLWEELTPPPGRTYGLLCLRIADSYAGYVTESQTWHGMLDRGLTEGKRISKEWGTYLAGEMLLFHEAGAEAQARCFRGTAEERKAYYKEQRRTLRSNTYLRLHENQRTANVGNFCQQEDWEALISKDLRPLKPTKAIPVFIGLDLAVAPGGDNCALIGVYQHEGKTKVAFHRVWKGALRLKRLSLIDDVAPYILKRAEDYDIAGVHFDPWQAIALTKAGGRAKIDLLVALSNCASECSQPEVVMESCVNPFYDNDDDFEEHEVRAVDLSSMRRIGPGMWMSDLVKKSLKPNGPDRYS